MVLRYGPAAISALIEGIGGKDASENEEFLQWQREKASAEDWRWRTERERALKGLPPASDAEFYKEWMAQMDEIENPRIVNLHFDANGCPIERPAGEPEYISNAEFDARSAKGWGFPSASNGESVHEVMGAEVAGRIVNPSHESEDGLTIRPTTRVREQAAR